MSLGVEASSAGAGREEGTGGSVRKRRPRRSSSGRSLLAYGEPIVWLTGGSLVFALVMIIGLLGLIAVLGLRTFQPNPLVEVTLRDGRTLMGEVSKQDVFVLNVDHVAAEPPDVQAHLLALLEERAGGMTQLPARLKQSAERLSDARESVAKRRDTTIARIEQLQEKRSIPDDPVGRARMIRYDKTSLALQKLRDRLTGLDQRGVGLDGELDAANKATAFYENKTNQTVDAILAAEDSLKRAGVSGLIAMARDVGGDPAIRFRRRMLRTGNYELTNEHFNWVADFQIAAEGERRPSEATLVERTSWGRFYGKPQQFLDVSQRPVTQGERDYRGIVTFLETHGASLTDQQEVLESQLDSVNQDYRQTRLEAIRSFIESVEDDHDDKYELQVIADGAVVPVDELSAESDVSEVRSVLNDSTAAWREFNAIHDVVREREHEAEHLEKHALGQEYADQERARLAVRQAEIDYDIELLEAVSARLVERANEQTLRSRLQKVDAAVAAIERRYPSNDKLTTLGQQLKEHVVAEINTELTASLDAQQVLESSMDSIPDKAKRMVERYIATEDEAAAASMRIQEQVSDLRSQNERYRLAMLTAEGHEKELLASEIVRAFQPNQMSSSEGWQVYFSRWWEFLTAEPREANSEGGVMPAIWGTVVMTLLMSIAVVPFGVMAALYLREYAKAGFVVSIIRIAINNLAGVPSIVFGVFGLGFFCYIIGAYVDGGPENARFAPLPTARWFGLVGALAISGLLAFLTSLIAFGGRPAARTAAKRWLGYLSLLVWVFATGLFFVLVFSTPFFSGFHEANLPSPTWGKPGIVWAALTLSLLMTLPVVIVSTEEALSAVPNSMREGSYGCGASKWQTIRRIVLPHAMPGIMTGMILAMARGAGEVAPLMLTGAVKLAPELPLDGSAPFLHGSRSFMHLGFHIFDVGFQSQNSEAAKPMVYTTTLLLIVIITSLNLLAVWLRAYLRKRFASGQF